MSKKKDTQGLLKIKIFWNKDYDAIIFFPLCHKPKLIAWFKLNCWCGHVTKVFISSISIKNVIITSILYKFDQKNHFFVGWSWFQLSSLGLGLDMALKFYTSVAKGLKLKSKIAGANFYVCKIYREKMVEVGICFHPE